MRRPLSLFGLVVGLLSAGAAWSLSTRLPLENRRLNAAFLRKVTGHGDLDLQDPLCLRVMSDFGAVFVVGGGGQAPTSWMFPDAATVTAFQEVPPVMAATVSDVPIVLQRPALLALLASVEEARKAGLHITPAGPQAAKRRYEDTAALWLTRVEPAIAHWIAQGALDARERERILALPVRAQVEAVLGLEQKKLFFSLRFDKSILYSVAAPGTSQHLSMLALDVREHGDPNVRATLARHGWFQTVFSDLPHFTYLGTPEGELGKLGLRAWRSEGRTYWLPMAATRGPGPASVELTSGQCAF